MIDPTPPDMFESSGAPGRWSFSAAFRSINRINLLLAWAGVFRTRPGQNLLRKLAGPQWGPHMPPEFAGLIVEALAQPSSHRAMILETDRLLDACGETRRLLAERGLPRVPFILLAATHRPGNSEKMQPRKLFARILELAPGAEMRELPEIGHMIPLEAPDSVIQAVRDLLARMAAGSQVRGAAGSIAGTAIS